MVGPWLLTTHDQTYFEPIAKRYTMTIDQRGSIQPTPHAADTRRGAKTPEEAARQFEAILVRQFVTAMTEGLFKASLSGEEGPGWMKGQQDMQRDVMTDVLTDHLVERGGLRISDLLLRQWQRDPAQDLPTADEGEER